MKRAIPAFALLTVMASCASSPKIDYRDKTLHTRVNIWYNDLRPEEIPSANYHRGKILPAGTPVRVLDIDRKTIRFQVARSGEQYVLRFAKRDVDGMINEYFYRMFHEVKPKIEGRFTKKECRAIWLGELEIGMTKEAAVVSWGYPPAHKTMSLKDDTWTYWVDKTTLRTITFVGGKIKTIE